MTAGVINGTTNFAKAVEGLGNHDVDRAGDRGTGRIRLDYASLTGTTNPSPGHLGGNFPYYALETIASQVLDCGSDYSNAVWDKLSWMETL